MWRDAPPGRVDALIVFQGDETSISQFGAITREGDGLYEIHFTVPTFQYVALRYF